MRRRYLGLGLLAALLLSGAGCASIVSDDDTTVLFSTEPAGATCELEGDDDFAEDLITPDSLSLPAKAAPIFLSCKAEGHQRVNAELDTSMDGWILGNAIFGPIPFVGFVATAIDAWRAAGQRYPEQFHLILQPESFESAAARDAWFDRRRAEMDQKWHAAINELSEDCEGDWDEDCRTDLDVLNLQWDLEAEDLEERREAAIIVAQEDW